MPLVLQLSDSHLLPSGEKLYGRDVSANFIATLDAAKSAGPFDLVILTGDIAEDGSIESYQRVAEMLENIEFRHLVAIPGNHDKPGNLVEILPGEQCTLGPWRILPLSSHWEQHIEGKLSHTTLNQLEAELDNIEAHADIRYALIAVHHPPHFTCAEQMCGLSNADDLLKLTERDVVRLVISGHVHDDYAHRVGTTLFSTCPSTCAGFDHNPAKHRINALAPGAIIFQLNDDGSVGRQAVYT